ncbi:MAG TPA: methyl-accepting chemotaxis protein [Gammaproteobacteria bacterium]
MKWITRSLRNKILLIAGTGTLLVVGSALYGFSEIWHGLQSLQTLTDRLAGDETTRDTARLLQQAIDEEHSGILASLIGMLVAVLITFFAFLWFIHHSIQRPSRQLVDDLKRLADGDFSRPVHCLSHDEIGQVAESAGAIQAQLGAMLREIAGAASQLASASAQLSGTSEQANRDILTQQSETEQVATAMNQMLATVQEVARNAADAAEAARVADEQAGKGSRVVTEVGSAIRELASRVQANAEAIHSLEADSARIGSVVDVIRGIAEQTNLLALNAAIEAARAGEQGRGFAVVADEVRSLAQRTQQATTEIQQMIAQLQNGAQSAVAAMEEGQASTERAVDRAGQAGNALREITGAVSTIHSMNTQIASAAEEQGAVAEEINRNVVAINDVTGSTAQHASQTADASEEIAELASRLQQRLGGFRI